MDSSTKNIKIAAISVVLPAGGIVSNYQTASDLCFEAAERIFNRTEYDKLEIGGIIYVGASPDYRSPSTACVLQGRLGLSQDCFAFDLNQGAAGFAIGLKIVVPLAQSMSKNSILLVLGDTPSKWCETETLDKHQLKDAGSAILIEKSNVSRIFETQVSTLSHLNYALTINEGGFRVQNTSLNEVDFLFQSASKYGDLFESNEYSINMKGILSSLNSMNSMNPSEKLLIAGYYSEKVHDVLSEEGITTEKVEGNYLGSSITYAIVQKTHEKNRNFVINSFEIGEGLVAAFSRIEIETDGILPLEVCSAVFEDWQIDHQM